MARAIITLEFDGGGTIEITEVSMMPIHGGTQGAVLTQLAFEKVARACGVQIATPDEVAAQALADQAAQVAAAMPEPAQAPEQTDQKQATRKDRP